MNELAHKTASEEALTTPLDPQAELAKRLGMEVCTELPFLDWPETWEGKLNYSFCKHHLILPIRCEDDLILAAVANPLALAGVEEVRLLLGQEVQTVYCPAELLMSAIQEAFRAQGGNASELMADLKEEGKQNQDGADIYDLLDSTAAAPIIRLLNAMLKEAIEQGASDVHFEPLENDLRVRYRIDGVLHTRHAPPRERQSHLLTRLKVMAQLDIAEHRLPQDGRIKLRMGGREIDFRVSTIPVSHGERIVLRILDRGNVVLGFEKLGMPAETTAQLRRLTRLPEGILLVTGPTGSGKTTTLYSALAELNSDEVNIMTVEDPVEYKLTGIAQIGVRPKIGLTFAAGLRHILRQDPDVVMIGEIRDHETAEIAIQASLTGHLVLSTLHTNDAPSAITRLVDMGIEPYLLSSSIVGVLAQRLVRTICRRCIEQYDPSFEELKDIGLAQGPFYRGRGCDNCFGSGYKGRCGIYQLMPVNAAVRQQIVTSADATAMRSVGLGEGMQPLIVQGAELVGSGKSTVAEVLRVTRGVED